MNENTPFNFPVAVVGAGPAGLYAASYLACQGAQVALLNRDIKPGGLAEYGIFHNKHRMKNGLRKQFRKLLDHPNIHYYGNLVIGEQGDICLDDLREVGFQAIMVTVGAQGTKWLGLPGEDLKGVYHAKDLVYHFNQLPPFSQNDYPVGDRVVIIGVGNVMIDIANYCIRDLKVDEVISIARRGPADVKFTKKEMAHVVNNLDQDALDAEIARTAPILEKCKQDPEAAKAFILSALDKADERVSDTCFRFNFLVSPKAILGDDSGKVVGLEVDETTLELRDSGETKAVRLGTSRVVDCDTVVFCIGDRVDSSFGLSLDEWKDFAKHPKPHYPIDDISYEAYNPEKADSAEGIFLAGWAREASSGLVGAARKDGERGAKALLQHLENVSPEKSLKSILKDLEEKLNKLDKPIVTKADWEKLTEVELKIAEEQGLESFKFSTNEEMLESMGLAVGNR